MLLTGVEKREIKGARRERTREKRKSKQDLRDGNRQRWEHNRVHEVYDAPIGHK